MLIKAIEFRNLVQGEMSVVEYMLVFLNAYRNNLQAHEITVVALHPKVFRVSYFP